MNEDIDVDDDEKWVDPQWFKWADNSQGVALGAMLALAALGFFAVPSLLVPALIVGPLLFIASMIWSEWAWRRVSRLKEERRASR